ncbi:dolichol-phosphate mannosyltransferase [Nitratireductor aquibiodomus]|uniref:Dolichol-phosphate mannosyltransferase n=1 Tax=Nitratireductor aquibiodomus TaxID=204799 RepID=A0A1H4IPV8_9HYPH|nr:glycosyltransferase family 2 protein [Nitratireductor aquibiodomus]SEB35696.1 dolichol-phosphate mannosyltransferase [Nitratireductor aquibiodomus]
MKAHPGNNAPTTDLPRATRRKTQRKLITISVPVYNEEENIPALHAALSELAERENGYDFEFLFTDNASTDRTFELLCERAREDDRIRVLRFSRNFGFQKSILTNYLNANGAAAVQIDADLQDPPRVISDFLRLWEQGYKVVYGIRRRRQENPVLNLSRRAFYAVITNLSPTPVPRDAGDFRLIDRVIIEHLRGIDEQTPYLRGIISSFGYAQTGVAYDRESRVAGRSKFGVRKLIDLAIDGLTAQSTQPLRYITIFGLVVTAVSGLMVIYYFTTAMLFSGSLPSGFTTVVLLLLVLIGLNSFILGLLGEYIGRIFNNTRSLPISIIEHRIEGAKQNKASAKTRRTSKTEQDS